MRCYIVGYINPDNEKVIATVYTNTYEQALKGVMNYKDCLEIYAIQGGD